MSLPLKSKTEVVRDYKRFVLNGTGGIGKSTALAVVGKNPLWFDFDNRFPKEFTSKTDFIQVKSEYQDVLQKLHAILAEPKLDNDWIVFDTATKLMSIVEDYTIAKDCKNDKDKYNAYGFGLKFSPQYFKEVLGLIDQIQAKHKVSAAFICHTKVKQFNNPMTEAYSKNVLDLPDQVAEAMKQWADYVGYAYSEVEVDKEKRKASGEPTRYISFVDSPLYEAKNSSSFEIPKRLVFDKAGEWAGVVFGETQSLLAELDSLVASFPPQHRETVEKKIQEAGVRFMGPKELREYVEAGKQKLKQ